MSDKQLSALAVKALQAHGNDIDKAIPDFIRAVRAANLINDLARFYLQQVVERGADQGTSETQASHVSSAPVRRRGRVKVHEHMRQRQRTPAEMEAARAARLAGANAVFVMLVGGRELGQIRFGELASLKRDLVHAATQGLMLHTIEVRDAVIAELIENHCTVPSQLLTVKEIIDAPTLEGFVRQADQEAPRRIAEAMQHASAAISGHLVLS